MSEERLDRVLMRNVGNEKLAATILYLLRGCSTSRPGVTGLLKMLWYADYWHYREHLSPITDARYVALPNGPVVDNYKELFAYLDEGEYVDSREIPIQGKEFPKQEFIPLMEPDEDEFSETEFEVLDRVIEEFGGLSGAQLIKRTHKDPPWIHVWDENQPGREIPYGLFRWMDNLPDEDDLRRANEVISSRPKVQAKIRSLNQEA